MKIDDWIISNFGGILYFYYYSNFLDNWYNNGCKKDQILHKLRWLCKKGWKVCKDGKEIPLIGWSQYNAESELVQPGQTVMDYWMIKKKLLLKRNSWPCLIIEGGIRGTSRKSRHNQYCNGFAPWRAGNFHVEFIPVEVCVFHYQPCMYLNN